MVGDKIEFLLAFFLGRKPGQSGQEGRKGSDFLSIVLPAPCIGTLPDCFGIAIGQEQGAEQKAEEIRVLKVSFS